MDGRTFVQFPHPGDEHRPDQSCIGWNTLNRPHKRKFMELQGAWVDGSCYKEGKLWAWGEWEPELRLIKELNAVTLEHPHYLWEPYWISKQDYGNLQNTDPFIYEGFYYSNCKQKETGPLKGLLHLDIGSIIVFGSAKYSKWIIDTVFVVKDSIRYDHNNYRRQLAEKVPKCYPARLLGTKTGELADRTKQRRKRMNVDGAIDLATGQTQMVKVVTVDARLDVRLLESIAALLSDVGAHRCIYRQRALSSRQAGAGWLARPGYRIKLHFIPSYCPRLDPIERLWGLMHRDVTHNKCYATYARFADATLRFLRETVPRNSSDLCDSVTDDFHVIEPRGFRVMT